MPVHRASEEEEALNPFAVPAAWSITLPQPLSLLHGKSPFSLPDLDLSAFRSEPDATDWAGVTSAFELPDVATFAPNALLLPGELTVQNPLPYPLFGELLGPLFDEDSDEQTNVIDESGDEDVWAYPGALDTFKCKTKLLTWANFPISSAKSPDKYSTTISEAGPKAFDAALKFCTQGTSSKFRVGNVVKRGPFLDALFNIGMGRGSSFFPYDSSTNSFQKSIGDPSSSGTSLQLCRSLVASFVEMREAVTLLRGVEKALYHDDNACAAKVALASAIKTMLDAVEEQLILARQDVQSLLQLQDLFERPKRVVLLAKNLFDRAECATSDAGTALILFTALQECEDRGEDIVLLQCVFARVSQPWLDGLEQQIGLRQDHASNPASGFLSSAPNASTLPSFVSDVDSSLIAETSECIRFMSQYHPDNPLLLPQKLNNDKARFAWTFQWEDINVVSLKAGEYQRSVQAALGGVADDQDSAVKAHGSTSPAVTNSYESIDPWLLLDDKDPLVFDRAPGQSAVSSPSDALYDVVTAQLAADGSSAVLLQPPTSLLSQYSLHPLIAVQHRLLTTITLRCIILTHSLHMHLQAVHQFHLFASGTFTASMTHVLFSPIAEATERARGISRSGLSGYMGLRLGSGQRREWPPTSSELSLALMGVLQTSSGASLSSFHAHNKDDFDPNSGQSHVTPSLSFALRTDPPPSDIEKILDANSIFALDFLKLVYTPPPALRIIFTDQILEKYDRIFKLLLRLLRVRFVLRDLFSNTCARTGKSRGDKGDTLVHGFRHRATTFINTLLSHMRYAGIETPWNELMTHVTSASTSLDVSAPVPMDSTHGRYSLASLKAAHERTLDTMLSCLFLRHWQRKLHTLLEDICGDILTFTKAVALRATDTDKAVMTQLHITYAALDGHIRAFKQAVSEAAERAEMGKERRGAEFRTSAAAEGVDGGEEKGMAEYLSALLGMLGT